MRKRITNWNNFPVITGELKSFSFVESLRNYLGNCDKYISRGNGRCYGDASLSSHVISMLEFDKILFFDNKNGVFKCQSGLTLDKILEFIIPHGWFLPVTPGTKFITVGGAVASDVHGKNHHVEGSFCRYVNELEVMLESGESVVCSRNQLGDLFEATCGGMGLTGVILNIEFRLKRIETSFILQRKIRTSGLDETIELFDLHKNANYSVAWVDCLKKGKGFGRSVFISGEHAKMEELQYKQKSAPLRLVKKKSIKFPFYSPSCLLNSYTMSIFNNMFYHLNAAEDSTKIVTYDSFFYPLDTIQDWNKVYGKNGFLQYQFVLPLGSHHGLVEILALISQKKKGSFLTVLKLFGDQEGLISFPMKGFTFALDFPVREGVFEFMEEIDQLVLKHGGRLYLSKDARMSEDTFKAGYPSHRRFAEILNKYNPHRSLRSMQADRLMLYTFT